LKESEDAAGEVAFEAAQRFAATLAVGLLASEVGGGVGVQAAFGDGEAVQRAVELAVAAAIEAVSAAARLGVVAALGVESADTATPGPDVAAARATAPRDDLERLWRRSMGSRAAVLG
jgi:hypothetical protein